MNLTSTFKKQMIVLSSSIDYKSKMVVLPAFKRNVQNNWNSQLFQSTLVQSQPKTFKSTAHSR